MATTAPRALRGRGRTRRPRAGLDRPPPKPASPGAPGSFSPGRCVAPGSPRAGALRGRKARRLPRRARRRVSIEFQGSTGPANGNGRAGEWHNGLEREQATKHRTGPDLGGSPLRRDRGFHLGTRASARPGPGIESPPFAKRSARCPVPVPSCLSSPASPSWRAQGPGPEARQGRQEVPRGREAHPAAGRGEDLQGPQGQGGPAGVPEDLLGPARPRPRHSRERVPAPNTRRQRPRSMSPTRRRALRARRTTAGGS